LSDTTAEVAVVADYCQNHACEFALSNVWEKGGEGGIELAEKLLKTLENKESKLEFIYDSQLPIKEKITAIATKIYGSDGVDYADAAEKQIARLTALGFGELPICMAKTQYSVSDNPDLLGRPEGFRINVREVYASAGAGFIVALTGTVMTMPGLPKVPAAYSIDVDEQGRIAGLF
jgi:formate--tetrahydrofolate ligase